MYFQQRFLNLFDLILLLVVIETSKTSFQPENAYRYKSYFLFVL